MCGICTGDVARRQFVNTELLKGTPHTTIEKMSRELGFPVKRETIRKHVKVCVPAEVEKAKSAGSLLAQKRWADRDREAAVSAGTPMPPPPFPSQNYVSPDSQVTPITLPDTDDMALLVRATAVAKLKAGELRVTTQDGLAAQSLIDKREEKQKDREVIVQIGRLLATQSGPPPIVVTEGTYEEVDDEADTRLLSVGES